MDSLFFLQFFSEVQNEEKLRNLASVFESEKIARYPKMLKISWPRKWLMTITGIAIPK